MGTADLLWGAACEAACALSVQRAMLDGAEPTSQFAQLQACQTNLASRGEQKGDALVRGNKEAKEGVERLASGESIQDGSPCD
jgi:hypothetical protein